MKLLTLLFSAILSSSSFAAAPKITPKFGALDVLTEGERNDRDDTRNVGNGGDVVVCKDSAGKVTSVELFDFYEARVTNGRLPIPPNVTDPHAIVLTALKELEKINPSRAHRYQKWAEAFKNEAVFVPDAKLTNIDDTNHIVLPAKCDIAQIAVQRSIDDEIQTNRYVVDKKLWDALDPLNQAGLILHEVIYREAIEGEINESRAVRLLNSLIFAGDISKVSLKAYAKLLKKIHASDIDVDTTIPNSNRIRAVFVGVVCAKKTKSWEDQPNWNCEDFLKLPEKDMKPVSYYRVAPFEGWLENRWIDVNGEEFFLTGLSQITLSINRMELIPGGQFDVRVEKNNVQIGGPKNQIAWEVHEENKDEFVTWTFFQPKSDFWTKTKAIRGIVCLANEDVLLYDSKLNTCHVSPYQTIQSNDYTCSMYDFNKPEHNSVPREVTFFPHTGLLHFSAFVNRNEFRPLCQVTLPILKIQEASVYAGDEDGNIRALIPNRLTTIAHGYPPFNLNMNHGMTFYFDGTLQTVSLASYQTVEVQAKSIEIMGSEDKNPNENFCRVVGFSSGKLAEFTLRIAANLVNTNGQVTDYPAQTRLRVDEKGFVKESSSSCFPDDSQREFCRYFRESPICEM